MDQPEIENRIRVGILTISDRCSQGLMEDLSGPAIQGALPQDEYVVSYYAVIPDDRKMISTTLRRWSDELKCDIILTTGGTGFAKRDVTPEATLRVLEREAPNISQYLLFKGLQISPKTALSRAVAGSRGSTLIVNLPGSPNGAGECTTWLLELLPHAVSLLKGETKDHPVIS